MLGERTDPPKPRYGKYAAYMRVSTDDQTIQMQEHKIKEYLNGGEHQVEWFADQGVSSGEAWIKRQGLQDAIAYCKESKATLIVYSLDRLSRRVWESLRFLEEEVDRGEVKFEIVTNPHITRSSIALDAMLAEMERDKIRTRTAAGFSRVKKELEEKGRWTTKAGKVRTSMGNENIIEQATPKAAESHRAKAKARAARVGPVIQEMRDRGMTWRGISMEFNKLDVPSPGKLKSKVDSPSKKNLWWAQSVLNTYKIWKRDRDGEEE